MQKISAMPEGSFGRKPEGKADLAGELAWAKAWLIETALPLWGSQGFDSQARLFEERFDFAGMPVHNVPHRLMVQCRQVYVFSHATLLGWYDGRELVKQALSSMLGAYVDRTDAMPYGFSVHRDGQLADPRQDCYALAFLLFTLAWARRLLGAQVPEERATSLLRHLDAALRHPGGLGFIDGLPRPDGRLRQNPQMHLLEAALEVETAFGCSEARRLADHLFELFRSRLFSATDRALREVFDDGWNCADPRNAVFEPGHHFEWMWLLDRYGARSGLEVDELVTLLGARAYEEGVDADGTVIETIRIRDAARVDSRRCWATCEGLKAAAAEFRNGRNPALASARATKFLSALRICFLSGPFPGGWIDRIDANGRPLVDYVPASTLYHVFLAIAESANAFGDPSRRS